MRLNPDFRGSDDVITPVNINLTGWTDGTLTEKEAIDKEKRDFAMLDADMPCATKMRVPQTPEPAMLKKWNDFQQSKGRYSGSNDMSLLDEFVAKQVLIWLAQIIGSCVMSNTFRAYVIRQMWEIVLLGSPEEYIGRNEFGTNNYSFYCPWSYGMARRRANMNSGDGLYCKPMAESLMKDGVLPCSTPKLIELTRRLGVADERDYPEPQGNDGAAIYRRFGNWQYLDELKPYSDYPVLECPPVTDAQQLWDLLIAGKPTFVCSMEAIRKVGTHPDGFSIHARDPNNQWAHNMAFHGAFIASDGERFFRQSNESWGEKHIYNRKVNEVESSFRAGRLTMRAIGEVRSAASAPPLIE
jgi:hypothetical protein